MRKKNGFTLVEVQIASLLVTIILVATGVIFFFALSSMRYMQDSYETYWNAHIAMKVISKQIMLANRYGWSQGVPNWIDENGIVRPLELEPYGIGDGTTFPQDVACINFLLPTLRDQNNGGAYSNTSTAIYLRQERPPLSFEGNISGNPQDYRDDIIVLLYWWDPGNNPSFEPRQLLMKEDRNTNVGGNPIGLDAGGQVIASNIAFLQFEKIAFNCVGIRLRVEGRVPSPLGGRMNQLELNTVVTLRCAAAQTCEPWGSDGGATNPLDNMW